jgi:glucosylglycerate synthase
LAEETLLTDDFLRQLINVGEVDIVVGLATHNHAKTIGPIVSAIQAGILKCFPRERVAIINADGGSQDDTPALVTGASIDDVWRESKVYALRTLHAISTRYGGPADPLKAMQTILTATDLLRARACVMISPDSTSIEPDWIQRLVRPIYDNFDLVCPIYARRRSEGALVRNVLYPMTRAVYGQRIREPYPSEFAVSGRMATDFLANGIGHEDWAKMGPELSVTIMAITGKYRVCESYLGAKTQSLRGAHDMVAVMRHTVGALFSSLDSHLPTWREIKGSQAVPVIGTVTEIPPPETARINRKRLHEMFASGVAELDTVLKSILSPQVLSELQSTAAHGIDQFNYSDELWTRTVFEFAASYHKSTINRDHILQALVPLYRGRSLTFLMESRNGDEENVEMREESLCADFERLKPYLLEMWADGK